MADQTNPAAAVSADQKLAQVQSLLGRMQELAMQVSSGKCTPSQCAELQTELVQLRTEIENITGSPA